MDKIIIKGLEVFAYHGVNSEEKENGQSFVVDLILSTSLEAPGKSDDLADTVNYAKAVKTVKRVMAEKSYNLIERAAQAVADAVLSDYPSVESVLVTLKKPEAPINASFDYVAVQIERSR
ncbi:MAG: dihydroneopterin aldolase [Clostridiales bacterium]|nr:dihydroneopterin aldolase [Clostridiales bacterium]